MNESKPIGTFLSAAQELGISFPPSALPRFQLYFQELVAWNQKVNLTAITDPELIWADHFIDSLIPEKMIPPGAAVMDIGSGAGFPGIPLKVVRPDIRVTLVDASQKKVFFERHIIRTLGLKDIEAIQTRVENLRTRDWGQDIVIGRAFAPLRQFLATALPLRALRGRIIAMKGPNLEKELSSVQTDLDGWGIILKSVHAYLLPQTGKKRFIVVFE